MTDSAAPQTKVSRRRWWIHLILIGGYFTASIPIALTQIHHRFAHTTSRGLLIASGFEIAIFSVVFALGWLASRASAEELLLKWRQGWWTVPLGIAYSIAMRLAIAIALLLIIATLMATGVMDRNRLATLSQENRSAVERIVDPAKMQHDRFYFWVTLTIVSFGVAGLREELWRSGTLAAMRKLWPNKFGDRNGQIGAVALIAIAFGLGHLSLGVIAAALALILGLLLGIIMVVHESIWPR